MTSDATATKRRPSCLSRLHDALETVCMEVTVISLTIVSVLAITGELLINLKIIQVPPDTSTARSADCNDVTEGGNGSATTSAGGGVKGGSLPHELQVALFVCHYVSLVVAAAFVVEMMLRIISRIRAFMENYWQVLDAVIVVATMAAEIAFTLLEKRSPLWETLTYVVILRLWRIPHVCFLAASNYRVEAQREAQSWVAATHRVESQTRSLKEELRNYKERVRELEEMLQVKEGRLPREMANGHVRVTKRVESDEWRAGQSPKSPRTLLREADLITDASEPDSRPTFTVQDNVSELEDEDARQLECSPSKSRKFSRTESESSLSVQAMEHEVHVQIEDRNLPPVKDEECSVPMEDDDQVDEGLGGSENQGPARHAPSMADDLKQYVFTNLSYQDDEIDAIMRTRDMQVIAEFEGSKTYRSAEGIPMTSL